MIKVPALCTKAELTGVFSLMDKVNEFPVEIQDRVYEPRTLRFVTPEMRLNTQLELYEGVLVFQPVLNSDLPEANFSTLEEVFSL